MNTDSLAAKIAFVGAGRHATEALYPNIALIPEFDLVAVCDLDETRAARFARRFGAPKYFTDVDEMLDKVALDGVCVCGPPEMQYDLTLHCLSRGHKVFVEKPPAPDHERAQQLVAMAESQKTFGMIGFMKRFAPANLVAKEHMNSPEFGKLTTISLLHGCGPWDDMNRMMIFAGIHMLDLARFFGGDIASISATHNHVANDRQAIVANLVFRNGVVGCLNVNSCHHWRDCFEQTYLTGTGCGIVIDASRAIEVMSDNRRFARGEGLELGGWSSRYYVSGNMAEWWAGGHYTRGYYGELSHFARACLGLVEPAPSLKDGVEALRLIRAIIISACENGRVVNLSEVR